MSSVLEHDEAEAAREPWDQRPGERTAFGDEVRRTLGPPNQSTRAIPYLFGGLILYTILGVWSQSYATRIQTSTILGRIDRLEKTIREHTVRIGESRPAPGQGKGE